MHSQVLGANLSNPLPELAPVLAAHKMIAKKPGVSGQVPSAQSLLPLAPAAAPAQAATSCDARGWGWEEEAGKPSSCRKGQAEITQVGARATRLSPRTANHGIVRVRGPRPPPATSLLRPAPQRSGSLISLHARMPPLMTGGNLST